MSEILPTFAGWHPDTRTGGTKYWDGTRWSGDTRPRRRSFAPACSFGPLGILLAFIAVMWMFLSVMGFNETQNVGPLVGGIIFVVLSIPVAVYLQRGQGPSTAEVERRLAQQRKERKSRRRAANVAGFLAGLGRRGRAYPPATRATTAGVEAEQIRAIANPATARALQNLQQLLYTRTLTDDEYQSAKDKLLGTHKPADSLAQIEKLAELHEAGILGDVEFSAAKARALGL